MTNWGWIDAPLTKPGHFSANVHPDYAKAAREAPDMTELDYPMVAALMARFSYKPNFQYVVIAPDTHHGPWVATLQITMYVPNSNAPHRKQVEIRESAADYRAEYAYHQDLDLIPVMGRYTVPCGLRKGQFFTPFLRGIIRSMEDHETDEWFRVDSTPLNDPHAAEKRVQRKIRDKALAKAKARSKPSEREGQRADIVAMDEAYEFRP